jgi:hypothetical protein
MLPLAYRLGSILKISLCGGGKKCRAVLIGCVDTGDKPFWKYGSVSFELVL